MNPHIESEQPLLILTEDDISLFGGLVKRGHQNDAEQRSKILAMLKARDEATRSDVEPVE
jgi:hypothetical protein